MSRLLSALLFTITLAAAVYGAQSASDTAQPWSEWHDATGIDGGIQYQQRSTPPCYAAGCQLEVRFRNVAENSKIKFHYVITYEISMTNAYSKGDKQLEGDETVGMLVGHNIGLSHFVTGTKIRKVVARPVDSSSNSSASAVFWTDPATGLMWTRKDNGEHVSWNDANNYCRNLTLQNASWRLPTIEELERIYDATEDVGGAHIKGAIRLGYSFIWSGTPYGSSMGAFGLNFRSGQREAYPQNNTPYGNTLCVRQSK
jgi:hypothetical protein